MLLYGEGAYGGVTRFQCSRVCSVAGACRSYAADDPLTAAYGCYAAGKADCAQQYNVGV